MGIRLRRAAINGSDLVWKFYNLELRDNRNPPSEYYNGLFFDHDRSAPWPFKSDRFVDADENLEPHDRVTFGGGYVTPSESVSMEATIPDPGPVLPASNRGSARNPRAAEGQGFHVERNADPGAGAANGDGPVKHVRREQQQEPRLGLDGHPFRLGGDGNVARRAPGLEPSRHVTVVADGGG